MLANNLNRGFTILEMVLVIAILSGLLGLGIYSFRPTTLFSDANKIKSDLEVGLINNALKAYYSEKGRYPDVFNSISSGTYEICRYNLEPCPTAGINLDILVDEKFIPEIPIRSYDNPNFTGYKVLYLSTADNYERDYYLAFASDGDLAQVVIPTPSSQNADNALLSGRVGGQTLHGGKEAGENLTLRSTSNTSKGKIFFGTSAYDEANDRLGVGNTSPGSRLVVKGISATSATSALNVLNSAETSALFVRDDRNVGIGTTSPNANLEIAHNGAGTFGVALRLNQNTIGNSDGPKIAFNKTMTASKKWTAGILDGVNVGDFAISEDGDYTGGFGTPRLTVRAGGNVGIGTTTPGYKLAVVGGDIGLDPDRYIRFRTTGAGASNEYSIGYNSASDSLRIGTLRDVYGRFIDLGGWNGATWTSNLFINSWSGNVGIGTTSPGVKLDVRVEALDSTPGSVLSSYPVARFIVNGSSGGTRGLELGAPTGGLASPVYLKVFGTSNRFAILNESNAENFTILNNGNVGIGTTNPANGKLQVNKTIRIDDDLGGAGSNTLGNAASLYIGSTNGGGALQYNANSGLDLWMYDAGQGWRQRLTVDKLGNVGIGTTNPGANRLQVDGRFQVGDGTNSVWAFGGSSGGLTAGHIGTINNVPLAFFTNSSAPQVTILTNGKVGIGTTDPDLGGTTVSKFTINQSDGSTALAVGNGSSRRFALNGNSVGSFTLYDGGSSIWNAGLTQYNGNVGIGTTSPGSHRLSVLGTAGLSSGTAWTNTSDSRLKNVETNLKESSILDKLLKLNPVSFRWNDLHNSLYGSDKTKLNYGFVAQEVEPIFPDMITTDENGYKWYNPSGFEAVLTASIQSQQTQITSNTQKVAEVANDLKDVQQKLEILTNKIEPKVIFNSKSGTTVLSESKTSVFVQTTEIRIDSLVMVTSETVIPYALAVTEKVPNQGFRVEIPESAQKDIKFSWLII